MTDIVIIVVVVIVIIAHDSLLHAKLIKEGHVLQHLNSCFHGLVEFSLSWG
jgi:hypothetical protein